MLEVIDKPKEFSIKKNQLCGFVKKVWGHEEWIVNSPKYCGKKLVFLQGYRCSMHYHKIKDETFYLLSGRVLLETTGVDGIEKSRIMTPGDVQHIPTKLLHRVTAIVDSEVIEFSTFHMEEDSYRIENSGRVDLSELNLTNTI